MTFQEFMHNFYLSALDSKYMDKVIDTLSDIRFDYRENNNQLFNELNVGRLNTRDTLIIYKTLVEKRNYVMTTYDLNHLIDHCKHEKFEVGDTP